MQALKLVSYSVFFFWVAFLTRFQVKEVLLSRFLHILSFLHALPSSGTQNMLQCLASRIEEVAHSAGVPELFSHLSSCDLSQESIVLPDTLLEAISTAICNVGTLLLSFVQNWKRRPSVEDVKVAAQCAAHLSLLKLLLLLPQERVDPVVRRALSRKQCLKMVSPLFSFVPVPVCI